MDEFLPVCSETFPKGDGAVCTAGHDPGVWSVFGFGAHTYISIQSKSQQQTTQKCGMILTVALTITKIHQIDLSTFIKTAHMNSKVLL